MTRSKLTLALAMGLLAASGCSQNEVIRHRRQGSGSGQGSRRHDHCRRAQPEGPFLTLAKAAGLDATLAGPGPYTVFVPDDGAFDKLPAGTVDSWSKPEARTDLTRTLTYHILPGTVLADDIGKAIDSANGKAQLATMGGQVLTATREDGKIVISDAAGGKAVITKADETRANGVVHETNAVLMPSAAT